MHADISSSPTRAGSEAVVAKAHAASLGHGSDLSPPPGNKRRWHGHYLEHLSLRDPGSAQKRITPKIFVILHAIFFRLFVFLSEHLWKRLFAVMGTASLHRPPLCSSSSFCLSCSFCVVKLFSCPSSEDPSATRCASLLSNPLRHVRYLRFAHSHLLMLPHACAHYLEVICFSL